MTLAERLAQATAMLAEAGLEEPRREARVLLGHATGLDGAGLLRHLHAPFAAPWFDQMLARRAAREPMALIIGHQPFWTLDLAVTADTLIPRADSETLVEAALAAFPRRDVRRVLDLGTGTGCLLLAAVTEFADSFGVGVDRSAGAAALARHNARHLGLAGRTAFLCGDWAAALGGCFDLVLCNPPYIESAVIPRLMPEVAWYEPASALDGGVDGLTAYRAVTTALPALLVPGGVAILELGAGQAEAVGELAEASGLRAEPPRADAAGVQRALTLRRAGKKLFGEARRAR